MKTQIHFVRHGHVDNPDNIFYGRIKGFRLDQKGKEDATRAANVLKDKKIKAIYSSPLLRARQTAKAILFYYPELTLKKSKLITEVSTHLEGKPNLYINSKPQDAYANKNPIFEQPEDILNRTEVFIWRIRRKHHIAASAVVTHGDIILFLIFRTFGIDITNESKNKEKFLDIIKEYPATGSITTLTFSTNRKNEIPEIAYINPSHSHWSTNPIL